MVKISQNGSCGKSGIYIGLGNVSDLYGLLIAEMEPARGTLTRLAKDEEDFLRKQPVEATTIFEKNRKRVEGSLKRLVGFLWDYYNLPRSGIIEYGSGATGYYYASLKPDDATNWLQVEINPNAIAENQRRNPSASIVDGSSYDIKFREVPMITGLSSFDCLSDLPRAVGQVEQALSGKGYFFHIQDVRPGHECVTAYLRRSIGAIPDFAFADEMDNLFGFIIGGKRVTSVDIFKRAIGDAIAQNPGLDVILNDYITLCEPIPMPPNKPPYDEHYFLNAYVRLNGTGRRYTTVLATIARKHQETEKLRN